MAEWLARPNKAFTQLDCLNTDSTVLELGTGISGIVPCVLAPKVKAFIATDQPNLLKTLRENVEANATPVNHKQQASRRRPSNASSNVTIMPLDWEEDDIRSALTTNGLSDGVDVVLACDCIYNYALIEPFVDACAEICRLRRRAHEDVDVAALRPTVCLIAQQLRQSDVFEQWLQTCLRSFRVWRMPTEMLNDGLREGSGFAVHVAILRE